MVPALCRRILQSARLGELTVFFSPKQQICDWSEEYNDRSPSQREFITGNHRYSAHQHGRKYRIRKPRSSSRYAKAAWQIWTGAP